MGDDVPLSSLPCYVEGFDEGLNLRDLGGWPTRGGGRTRRGQIFRSARLSELDDAELVSLQRLGIAWVVDLRPPEEARLHPDPRLPSLRLVSADAGRDSVAAEVLEGATPAQVVELVARNTAAMAFGNRGVRRVLELLEEGRTPLLFHCNSGRDRSGVCAMVVLMALGCPDEVLLADYMLTNRYRAPMLAAVREAYGPLVDVDPRYEDLLTLMVGVLPSVGERVLTQVDERYPSREAFLRAEYGLDTERLGRLRDRYVE